jgi:small redox-active disulfide protein 2
MGRCLDNGRCSYENLKPQKTSSEPFMNILVIGPGCTKCKTLAHFTEQAVTELGVSAEIHKITDLKQIMALGVMMTPALAVNGTIKVVGKVPTIPEIKAILRQAS